MSISGFPSLRMPLDLADPEYSEHVYSVFLLFLRVCDRNWPWWIGPCQFLNYSLYSSPGTIQSLSSLDQVNQFISASGSVNDQGTKESSYSLYNQLHRGESILSLYPFTLYDHLTTTMVDVPPTGTWLLIISLYGAESSIHIDSWLS